MTDWLEPGEVELAHWTAAVPTSGGRAAKYGGRLVLTDRRLVWLPLQVSAIVPVGGAFLPISAGGQRWEARLDAVERAEPDADRRTLLHIVGRQGARSSFLVGAGRFAPVWSKKSAAACADAVSRITAAVRG